MTATTRAGSPVESPGATATSRRTVLHVLGILNRGGAERRTLEVISALRDSPVRFLVCTLSGRPGSLAHEYRSAGARVIPLRLRDPRFAVRFLRVLRREDVDVVHSHVHFSSGLILMLAWLAATPGRIAHFRSDADGKRLTAPRRLRNSLLRSVLRRTATAIVGVAPGTLEANWGPRWRDDPRFTVIPNGIDLTIFVREPLTTLREELGLPTGELLLVHVGRADIPTKNRELAIEIAGECRRRDLPVHLVFVGRDGGSAGDAEQRLDALQTIAHREDVVDRVHFLGEREDIAALLSAADVLLLTSTREGLPGILLEAVACGTPAVSSGVAGAVYIAEGVPAVTIVPIGSPLVSWVRAVQRAVGDEPGGRAGRVTPSLGGTQFDLAMSLERYRELWHLS